MNTDRSVKVKDIVEKFQMEVLYPGADFETETLTITDVNRPGLQFVGFFDYFDPRRLQIIGKAEICLSPQKAGTGAIQSVDGDNGVLLAAARAEYRYKGRTESVAARLAVEAGDGNFRIVFTDLARSLDGVATGPVLPTWLIGIYMLHTLGEQIQLELQH